MFIWKGLSPKMDMVFDVRRCLCFRLYYCFTTTNKSQSQSERQSCSFVFVMFTFPNNMGLIFYYSVI